MDQCKSTGSGPISSKVLGCQLVLWSNAIVKGIKIFEKQTGDNVGMFIDGFMSEYNKDIFEL